MPLPATPLTSCRSRPAAGLAHGRHPVGARRHGLLARAEAAREHAAGHRRPAVAVVVLAVARFAAGRHLAHARPPDAALQLVVPAWHVPTFTVPSAPCSRTSAAVVPTECRRRRSRCPRRRSWGPAVAVVVRVRAARRPSSHVPPCMPIPRTPPPRTSRRSPPPWCTPTCSSWCPRRRPACCPRRRPASWCPRRRPACCPRRRPASWRPRSRPACCPPSPRSRPASCCPRGPRAPRASRPCWKELLPIAASPREDRCTEEPQRCQPRHENRTLHKTSMASG